MQHIRLSKIVNALVMFIIIPIAGTAVYLYFTQENMLYHPRPYTFASFGKLQIGAYIPTSYVIGEAQQVAHYMPPVGLKNLNDAADSGLSDNVQPRAIWILFSGNGGLALDWHETIANFPDERVGFLLVDYPGYGKNEGSPSPANIRQAGNRAVEYAVSLLSGDREQAISKIAIGGYSLGAAAALMTAADSGVSTVLLLAPFSSMQDMACRRISKPFCYLLKHHYNNEEELKTVLTFQNAKISILHGDHDDLVPIVMGEQLAAINPNKIIFKKLHGINHSDVFDHAGDEVIASMVNLTPNS